MISDAPCHVVSETLVIRALSLISRNKYAKPAGAPPGAAQLGNGRPKSAGPGYYLVLRRDSLGIWAPSGRLRGSILVPAEAVV